MSAINNIGEDLQSMLENENIVEDAGNSSTTQLGKSGTLELSQKNVVKFNNQVESTIIELKCIDKLRSICEKVEEPKTPWPEILLGISTLFAGASLSAIVSGMTLTAKWESVVFYIFSPVIAVGCGVAFHFTRKQNQVSAKSLADHIVELLPEVDTERGKEHGDNSES